MNKFILSILYFICIFFLLSCNHKDNSSFTDDGYPNLPTERVEGEVFYFDPSEKYALFSGGILYKEDITKPERITFIRAFSPSSDDFIRNNYKKTMYGFEVQNLSMPIFEEMIKSNGLNNCDKLYSELMQTLYYQTVRYYREMNEVGNFEQSEIAKNLLKAFSDRNIIFQFYNNSIGFTYFDLKCDTK